MFRASTREVGGGIGEDLVVPVFEQGGGAWGPGPPNAAPPSAAGRSQHQGKRRRGAFKAASAQLCNDNASSHPVLEQHGLCCSSSQSVGEQSGTVCPSRHGCSTAPPQPPAGSTTRKAVKKFHRETIRDFLPTTVFELTTTNAHKKKHSSLTQLLHELGIDSVNPSHGLHQIFLSELDLYCSSRLQNASPGRKGDYIGT